MAMDNDHDNNNNNNDDNNNNNNNKKKKKKKNNKNNKNKNNKNKNNKNENNKNKNNKNENNKNKNNKNKNNKKKTGKKKKKLTSEHENPWWPICGLSFCGFHFHRQHICFPITKPSIQSPRPGITLSSKATGPKHEGKDPALGTAGSGTQRLIFLEEVCLDS